MLTLYSHKKGRKKRFGQRRRKPVTGIAGDGLNVRKRRLADAAAAAGAAGPAAFPLFRQGERLRNSAGDGANVYSWEQANDFACCSSIAGSHVHRNSRTEIVCAGLST